MVEEEQDNGEEGVTTAKIEELKMLALKLGDGITRIECVMRPQQSLDTR